MKTLLSAATFGLLPVSLPHASNPDHPQTADMGSAQLACDRHDIAEATTKEESYEPHPWHASGVGGIARLSVLALLRWITSSNFTGSKQADRLARR